MVHVTIPSINPGHIVPTLPTLLPTWDPVFPLVLAPFGEDDNIIKTEIEVVSQRQPVAIHGYV